MHLKQIEIESGKYNLKLKSQKPNEKVWVVALFSTIFVLLNLIACTCEINFEHKPKFGSKLGCAMGLLFMLILEIRWFLKQKD